MTENLIIIDSKTTQRKDIIQSVRDCTAVYSDARIELYEFDGDQCEDVRALLNDSKPVQIAVLEIINQLGIELAKDIRRVKESAEMMLIADAKVSPMDYLTPEVRACSLLLRPYTPSQLRSVVRSFIESYFIRSSIDKHGSIVLENRDGLFSIPFNSIYYIEVKQKKVYFRQQDREYSKYDSLDNIGSKLPDYFIQCHRSYIVNTRRIERVRLSENTIYLEHGIAVPLARSYRDAIREFINEKHNISLSK